MSDQAAETTCSCDSDAKGALATTLLKEAKRESSSGNTIAEDCFPQGCQFSPDGLCVLTAVSHRLELYNTPLQSNDGNQRTEWKAALSCQGGDAVRSFAWYPHMNSSDPSTCCFIAAARDQPIHLYDAYAGATRATYRPYNALDEMEAASTVCFANNGQQIIAGGFRSQRNLQIFDLGRPGRDSTTWKLGKTRRSKDGQKGLVSALATTPISPSLLAVGTYSPGSIYLYDLRAPPIDISEIVVSGTCIVGHGKSHSRKRKHFVDQDEEDINFSTAKILWYQGRARRGVTQVEFVDDMQYLFSSSRRGNAVLQWDLRRLSSLSNFCPGVGSFATDSETNQRVGFQLWGGCLWIGGRDKCIRVYDLKQPGCKLSRSIQGFRDVVNDLSLTSVNGRTLLASASGSRHFPLADNLEDDDSAGTEDQFEAGALQVHAVNFKDPTWETS